jgi:N-acetylglucosamine kinase-like BadF-type ATPase
MNSPDSVTYYLGVDGGQSHTTALIADEGGRLLGRGQGGPSNHTRAPGGRARLESAVRDSVGRALQSAGLMSHKDIRSIRFHSAHLALTGEPEGKLEVVQEVLKADLLAVDHDAPAALAGATAGEDGIIVLAGTGSVAFGTWRGQPVRIGGRGYLFADEGSAFAMSKTAVARAIRCEDRNLDLGELRTLLLSFFQKHNARDIAEDFYIDRISRDQLAAFALPLCELAERGNRSALEILEAAAQDLSEMAEAAAARLGAENEKIRVSFGGGVFKSTIVQVRFTSLVKSRLCRAEIAAPHFGADVGALLLAYRLAGTEITTELIETLRASM